jgi:hypothetical protein
MSLVDLTVFISGWIINNIMIIRSIELLFFQVYKITSINFGKGGGAYSAYVVIGTLITINIIALVELVHKIIAKNFYLGPSLDIGIFLAVNVINYFLLIYKSKYIEIVNNSSQYRIKSKILLLRTLVYILITFLLLILSIIW